MRNIMLKHNPYTKNTELSIDGQSWADKVLLRQDIGGERLQVWLDRFPERLRRELNTEEEILLSFYGIPQDCDDVRAVFEEIDSNTKIMTKESSSDSPEKKREMLIALANELQYGPFEEFRDKEWRDRFDKVLSPRFEIGVVATMSSGKSTLLNALMGQKLLPARQQATTANITRIWHDPTVEDGFVARSASSEEELQNASFESASLELLDSWNDQPSDHAYIELRGKLPMLRDYCSDQLCLVLTDTPGPNSSTNEEHRECTMRLLESQDQSMILYVLNGRQLATDDDASLLRDVRRIMENEGRQGNDRFLFVLNQMDALDPENNEHASQFIASMKTYLSENHSIFHPRYACASALASRTIRCPENATKIERRVATSFIEDSCEDEGLQLHRYTNAGWWVRDEVQNLLNSATTDQDKGLVYSGIPVIEAIIREYLYKHALPLKLSEGYDLVNTKFKSMEALSALEATLVSESSEANKLKEEIATIRKLYAERSLLDELLKKCSRTEVENLDAYKKRESNITNILESLMKTYHQYKTTTTSYEEAQKANEYIHALTSEALEECSAQLRFAFNDVRRECRELLHIHYCEYMSKIGKNTDLLKDFLNEIQKNFELEISIDSKSVNSYGEIEQQGTKKVWDRKWYNPISWFVKKEVPNYVTVYNIPQMIREAVEMSISIAMKACSAFQCEANHLIKNIVSDAEKKINDADKYIRKKFDELEKLSQESANKEKNLEELKKKILWLKRMTDNLHKVVEI